MMRYECTVILHRQNGPRGKDESDDYFFFLTTFSTKSGKLGMEAWKIKKMKTMNSLKSK